MEVAIIIFESLSTVELTYVPCSSPEPLVTLAK